MNTMDQIRAYMGQQAGPVSPAQVAEALEIDGKKVRQALYQAARQEAGVEALEDGTYTLIPGWKPAREAGEGQAPPAAAAAAAAAKSPRSAGRPRGKAKPAKASKATKAVRAAKDSRGAKPDATARTPGKTAISSQALAVLVQTILAGDAPITGRLRAALSEATTAVQQG